MNPEDISRKAELKKKKISNSNLPKKNTRELKTYGAFSLKVYQRIYPGRMNVMAWFLVCVPGVALVCLYLFDSEIGVWSLYTGVCCSGRLY
jgi:hypothetical protein